MPPVSLMDAQLLPQTHSAFRLPNESIVAFQGGYYSRFTAIVS